MKMAYKIANLFLLLSLLALRSSVSLSHLSFFARACRVRLFERRSSTSFILCSLLLLVVWLVGRSVGRVQWQISSPCILILPVWSLRVLPGRSVAPAPLPWNRYESRKQRVREPSKENGTLSLRIVCTCARDANIFMWTELQLWNRRNQKKSRRREELNLLLERRYPFDVARCGTASSASCSRPNKIASNKRGRYFAIAESPRHWLRRLFYQFACEWEINVGADPVTVQLSSGGACMRYRVSPERK